MSKSIDNVERLAFWSNYAGLPVRLGNRSVNLHARMEFLGGVIAADRLALVMRRRVGEHLDHRETAFDDSSGQSSLVAIDGCGAFPALVWGCTRWTLRQDFVAQAKGRSTAWPG